MARRKVATTVQQAYDYLRSEAVDGDVIVVDNGYQKQMVESRAIALGLDVVVEVAGKK